MNDRQYEAMVWDSKFSFTEKAEEFLKALPVTELLKIYNGVTEIENMEYVIDPDNMTEEQFDLLGKIFFDTSMDRYIEAFGEDWVKAHTKRFSKEDLYITFHPFGFITTMNHIHVTDKILDYLTHEGSKAVERVGNKALLLFVTGLLFDYKEMKQNERIAELWK